MKKPRLNVKAIKIRMIEKGDIKPGKVAEELGMSRSLFSYMIIRRSLKHVEAIAEFLGFDPEELIVFE